MVEPSLAPRPTIGSGHNYFSAEKKFKLYGYRDCLLNFCCLVVGLVGLCFSSAIKSVAEKSFDVKENYNKDLAK